MPKKFLLIVISPHNFVHNLKIPGRKVVDGCNYNWLLDVQVGLPDFCMLTCGISQGSILGPLWFILFINDLPLSQLYSRPRMYADDTTLTCAAEDAHAWYLTIVKMNSDLNKIQTWLKVNKLILNVKKYQRVVPNLNYCQIISQLRFLMYP